MNVSDLVKAKQPKTIGDYFSLSREIEQFAKHNAGSLKTFKIALLTSFTSKGIKEVLQSKIATMGVVAEFYVCDYQQYAQEILNPASGLYQFSPQVIFLFIDLAFLASPLLMNPYAISDEQRKSWVTEKTSEMDSLLKSIQKNSAATLVLHNFEIPFYSPLGILENRQNFGFIEAIELLNANLRQTARNNPQIFIFDFNGFASLNGKENIVDPKMVYAADIKIHFNKLPALCDQYLAYIKPLLGKVKKCIVLDLDNTLWGGVLGEDGINGIKLGPTPEGSPFFEFQKRLLALSQRGILLAINSKNNKKEVLEALKTHPSMILREENFSAMQINWENKVSNMRAIASELNIGIDSLVFFDDDELNCEMVKSELPEVLTICLPKDPALYVSTLTSLNEFNSLQLTAEDMKRSSQYVEEKKRKALQENIVDLAQYLANLQMTIKFSSPNKFNIPRLAQMSQKTNQFNTTTRRYSEEQISSFSQSDQWILIATELKDKFGDYGITGLAIIEKRDGNSWYIDTFLMSCRIIGRSAEKMMLKLILERAREFSMKSIFAEFIPSEKNAPAKDFYKDSGFELHEQRKGSEIWKFELSKQISYPDYFEVIEES